MFERMMLRAERAARLRAEARAREKARRLRERLPAEVRIEARADGITISARGLSRRLVLDAALRRALAEAGL